MRYFRGPLKSKILGVILTTELLIERKTDMKKFKLLSIFLAFVLVVSVFPFNVVYAVEGTEISDTQKTEEFALPDIVTEEEAVERGYIGRVKEEEKDNYTFIFKDSENMRTMRVYSHPVKYTDKDGNTKDITLDIQSRPGGGFETKDNSIKTTFGAKLSDGIRLQSEDVDIKLIPANSLNRATLSEDSKTVSYTLDTKTTLEYSLTYTGFKEDIVVNEYTGQTEYEFLLYTNGLTVKEEMGSYYLADEQGNRKANIGDIIIFTADERNNTLGELSCEEIKPNYAYLLTIHVDAEYLKDEKTVYPIRIDPTFEITSATTEGTIEDVTVYTGTSYYSGTSGILYLGTSNNYTYRILMKFPNLDLSGIAGAQITNASVELRDVMCQGVHVNVECRYYNGAASSWSESMINYWAAVCHVSNIGSVIDTKTVYYGNGNVPGISQRYSFNVTSAVNAWINGTHTPQQGLIFKATDESFSSTEDRLKYFGSYNRSDYRASFTLQYFAEAISIGGDFYDGADVIDAANSWSSCGYSSIYDITPSVQTLSSAVLNSTIVYFSSHGTQHQLHLPNGVFLSDGKVNATANTVEICDYSLPTAKLYIYDACLTASNSDGTGDNLCTATIESGVDCVIGWKQSIGVTDARNWQSRFQSQLIAGYSVQDAADFANTFSYNSNSSIKDWRIYGNNQLVIAESHASLQSAFPCSETDDKLLSTNIMLDDFNIKSIETILSTCFSTFVKETSKITITYTNEEKTDCVIDYTYLHNGFSTSSGYTLIIQDGVITHIRDNTIVISEGYSIRKTSSVPTITQTVIENAHELAVDELETMNDTYTIVEQIGEGCYDICSDSYYYKVLSTYITPAGTYGAFFTFFKL